MRIQALRGDCRGRRKGPRNDERGKGGLDSEHPAGTRYYIACGEGEVEGRNGFKERLRRSSFIINTIHLDREKLAGMVPLFQSITGGD